MSKAKGENGGNKGGKRWAVIAGEIKWIY